MLRNFALCILLAASLNATPDFPNQVAFKLAAGVNTFRISNSGPLGGGTLDVTINPGTFTRLGVAIAPQNTPPNASTAFPTCADPCGQSGTESLTAVHREGGVQYYWVVLLDSGGTPVVPFRMSQVASPTGATRCSGLGTFPQVSAGTVTTSPLPMPREITGGGDCYVEAIQVTASASSATKRLRIRVNNPTYANTQLDTAKFSVRINDKNPITGTVGSWADATAANVTVTGEGKYYGPFGHNVFNTLILRMAITTGVVVTGANTVEFRMNETDSITSGLRILEVNFDEPDIEMSSCTTTGGNSTECTTDSVHGYSTGDWVYLVDAPGPYGRLNGPRQITGTSTTSKFSFACVTTPTPHMLSNTCPNITVAPPVSTNTTSAPQPHMYVARQLIAQSDFTWDDPDTYAAPAGGDANNGKTVFEATNTSVLPNSSATGYRQNASCAMCHAQNSTDLKFYGVSNKVIIARVMFHGHTYQEGLDVAARVRGLDVAHPPMGRPENPPYQFGPGLDSQRWWDFGAGTGLDSYVVYGTDLPEFYAPGGSIATWAWNAEFKFRLMPSIYQFFDWNHWLPVQHPVDGFPNSGFLTNTMYTGYTEMRSQLVAGRQSGTVNSSATTLVMTAALPCSTNDILSVEDEAMQVTAGCNTTSLTVTRHTNGTSAASHAGAEVGDFTKYKASNATGGSGSYGGGFPGIGAQVGGRQQYLDSLGANESAGRLMGMAAGYFAPSTFLFSYFSGIQWQVTKLWELEHEFYLEGMMALVQTDIFGACTTCPGGAYPNKGWLANYPFEVGVHRSMLSGVNLIDKFPPLSEAANIGKGCQSGIWYTVQDGIYNGSGNQQGNVPIDVAYDVNLGRKDCSIAARPVGIFSGLAYILTQQSIIQSPDGQFVPANQMWYSFANLNLNFNVVRTAELFNTSVEITTNRDNYATVLLGIINSVSTATWQAWVASPGAYAGAVNCTGNLGGVYTGGAANFCDNTARILPELRYHGVSSTKYNAIRDWADAVFSPPPGQTWQDQVDATCSVVHEGGGSAPASIKCSNVP